MKITKKARQEAIEQLEQFADVWLTGRNASACYEYDLFELAYLAQETLRSDPPLWFSCDNIGDSIIYSHVYLEAAGLLREGWSPGELLERIIHES